MSSDWSKRRILPREWTSSCRTTSAWRQPDPRLRICSPVFLPSSLKQSGPLPFPPPSAVMRMKSFLVFWDSAMFSKVMQVSPELIVNCNIKCKSAQLILKCLIPLTQYTSWYLAPASYQVYHEMLGQIWNINSWRDKANDIRNLFWHFSKWL